MADDPPLRLHRGQVFERHRIEGVVDTGGVSVVYRARHLDSDELRALKMVPVADPETASRARREGTQQAVLDHLNLVRVHELLPARGYVGIAMEYVVGSDLERLAEEGPFALDDALGVFRAVAAGLTHAHAKAIIHRDVKPSNVMLMPTPRGVLPKLGDFGLVKNLLEAHTQGTTPGVSMGTPSYMAPEQFRDASTVDRRADLWSLGCVLYWLATGRRAFDDPNYVGLYERVAAGEHPLTTDVAPHLPERVHRAIAAMLTPDVQQRPDDPSAVVAFIEGELDAVPIPGNPLGELPPTLEPHARLSTVTLSSATALGQRVEEAASQAPRASTETLELDPGEIQRMLQEAPDEPERFVEEATTEDSTARITRGLAVPLGSDDETISAGATPGWLLALAVLGLVLAALVAFAGLASMG